MQKSRHKLILLLVAAVLLTVTQKFWVQPVKGFLFTASQPCQKFFWKTGAQISNFLKTPLEFKTFQKENEKLKERNLFLLKENVELKQFRQENNLLRKALKISEEGKFEIETAEVLQKEEEADVISISKGTNNGIFKGMTVMTADNVLLGTIIETFPKTARVLLISDQTTKFNIEIQREEKNILGVGEGKGGLKLAFDYIPKENQIDIGDVVITTAWGGEFPTGLLVGSVENIQKTDAEPYQKGVIKPFFKLENLQNVIIIKNTQQNFY